MGLRSTLVRWAVQRAHVLVVEAPGGWRERVELERAVAARGWMPAAAPAEADVLAIAGRPGAELRSAIEAVWAQLPGPRARIEVVEAATAGKALEVAATALSDDAAQRQDARDRPRDAPAPGPADEMHPAGIALASGAADRDGLELDVLHVPLGPVLPHWPAGLVLHTTLAGDLVTSAQVEVLDGAGATVEARWRPAKRVDSAARVLALAGWADAAAHAAALRDRLLVDNGPLADNGPAEAAATRLRTRVARSILLRSQLRGLARVDPASTGLPPEIAGDVFDRLLRLLQPGADARPDARLVEGLPGLVSGHELAAVRLLVASLDLDTTTTRTAADA